MNKTLTTLLALSGLGLAHLACAQTTLTHSWTAGGGAWTRANQPDWTWTDDPNPLYADQGKGSGATLYVTGMATVIDSAGGAGFANSGPLDSFFYTKGSRPSFSLQATDIVAGLQTITLTIDYEDISMTNIDDINLSLDFGLSHTGLLADSRTVVGSYPAAGFNWTQYQYTWDISALGTTDGFSINWGSLAPHSAFAGLQLTQVGAAIPEPATYAILCALAVLVAVASNLFRRPGGATGIQNTTTTTA